MVVERNAIIERLQSSMQATVEDGEQAGENQVARKADYTLTCALAELWESWEQLSCFPDSPIDELFSVFHEEVQNQYDLWDDLWEEISRNRSKPTSAWAYGFVKGVADAWEEYKGEVDI